MSNARTTSYPQSLNEASTTQKLPLGTIRDEGSKVYKYIQYEAGAGSVAGTAGRICYYHSAAPVVAYGNSLVSCDHSDSANGAIVAGQLVTTLADGEFGWILIEGLSATLETDAVAGAIGNKMTGVGATDGTLDVSALVTDQPAGILLNATASAQRVLLSCPR